MGTFESKPKKDNKRNESTTYQLLENLFFQLDSKDIIYCVLHSYQELPEYVQNDVDLLVHPKQVVSFRQCLLDTAEKLGWRLVKTPSRFSFHSFWLKNSSRYEFIQIDVWSMIHWKSVPWADTNAVLRNRKRFRTFYTPGFADEAAYLLIKDVIAGKKIKPKYLDTIKQAIQKEPLTFEIFLQWGFGKKVAAWIVQQASHENWELIEKKRVKICLGAIKQRFWKNSFSFLCNFSYFLWGHFISRVAKDNGFFLALIGPDGSGKSTVAEDLGEHLKPLFRKRVCYHGHFGLLPELKVYRNFLFKMIKEKPPDQSKTGTYEANNAPPHGLLRTLIYVFYYSLDYFLGHRIIRRFQAIGDLVVFDRYFYDWFIQEYYGRAPRWLLSILKCILPRPDLVVYLSNLPGEVHRRKPELTVGQIELQSQECRKIIKNMAYGMTVSTEQPPDKVAHIISKRVVKIMTERYQRETR